MKFEARYTPTIMDGPVIRWGGGYDRGPRHNIFSTERETDWSGEISASRNGVLVSGHWLVLDRQEDIDDFAACLRKAFEAHRRILAARDGGHDVAKAIVDQERAPLPTGPQS